MYFFKLPPEVTIFNTFVCRDTWLEGGGFQSGNREVETLHDLVTFAASVVRASEKKREKWPGHVLQSRYPTFLELDPSFGASDKTVGSEIQQTPSEVTQKWTALTSSCNGKQCLNITQNRKWKTQGASVSLSYSLGLTSAVGASPSNSVTRGGSTHASWLPKHKGKP